MMQRASETRRRGRRKNRLTTDAVREVRATFSRFLSILILSALAVAFLAGLRTTAPDMEYTADKYYDRTHMMDGYVLSTLGLTDGDLAALAAAPGVAAAEGGRTVDAIAGEATVVVRDLPRELNLLELTEGRLPEAPDECVSESLLMTEMGVSLGDTIELALPESSADDLARVRYTIVGVATSPLYAGPDRGSSSLGTGRVNGFVYIPEENFLMDYYSVAYLTFDGLIGMDSYSDAYSDRLDAYLDGLDALADERAQLRYDTLVGDAQDEIDAARQELNDARADADAELADAWQKLTDARQELDDGWADYEDGQRTYDREIKNAQAKLADARAQLQDGEDELARGQAQYESALAEYQAGLAEYEENKEKLDAAQAELDAGWKAYEDALAPYVGTPYYAAALAAAQADKAKLEAAQQQLDESSAQLAAAGEQLAAGKAALTESAGQLEEARAELSAGWQDYRAGQRELEREKASGRQELDDALQKLNDGEADYADGLAEYEDGKAEADEKIADAEQKLADAQAQVDDIDPCEWYVLGRDTNNGFASYSQDAERVGNLANIFPVIFFLVAGLACLTTMTRMVEDERTQIGALKALGFSRLAISKKYLGYAFWASFLGGLIGLAVGCTVIPLVVANAFNIMYNIPRLEFLIQPEVCILAVAAAVACTTGAALWACLSTLVDSPANLMRPKSPKAGKRVLLEHVKPIWSHLSFTWKVTVRNLFRYQRRFWMTVIGIGGCTALIVTGFGLHDSIFDILDKQFDEISLYDATVGLEDKITDGQRAAIETYLDGEEAVARYMACHFESVESSNGGAGRTCYIYTVGDEGEFGQFITLRHRKDSAGVALNDDGVVITEKLSELLGVSVGDTITLDGERRVEVRVSDIVESYVSHYVYMTEAFYRQTFGAEPDHNVLLVAYADGAGAEQSDRVSETLMAMDGVGSYSYIGTLRDTFTNSMNAINYAVMIIIIAAAALAFVVLYNLTNINITERMRELATLKVLGFYDGEVTAYVYRENVFLTIFGIALGLFLGRWLHAWMVLTVEVDLVMFGRTAPPYAYVTAAVLTLVFSAAVNIAAHFRLKKVDMVESLKTVE